VKPRVAIDALAGVRKADDDDDVYGAYMRRRKRPERPQPSASSVALRER
jgi:hypothetical protein